MSGDVRVAVVCNDEGERARVRAALDTATSAAVRVEAKARADAVDGGTDCLVVAGTEPGPARDVDVPVVVFGDADAVEAPAAVVSRSAGVAALADRLREVTGRVPADAPRVLADGGTASPEQSSGSDGSGLERLTDGFMTVDDEWTVTSLNRAGREIIGEQAEGLVGQNLWEAFPEAVDTVFEEEYRHAMESQEMRSFEEHYEPLDTWVEIRAYPSEDGLSIFFQDVTERKRARAELQESERALERLHTLAADGSLSRQEKIRQILTVGRDRLGVEIGFLTHISDGTLRIEEGVGDHPIAEAGVTTPLAKAYCRQTVDATEPYAVDDAVAQGLEDDPAYESSGLACYLGSAIEVDGEQYGTVCFADTEPRGKTFTESEKTFVDLLTDWVSYLLEQRKYAAEREAHQERLSGILNTTQSLMQARSREEVAEVAANAAQEVLGFDNNVVHLYDAAAGTLEPAAQRAAAGVDLDEPLVYGVDEGLPGAVFATGESRVIDDVTTADVDLPAGPIQSAMCHPMGVHGTISVGATEPGAFDETDAQVLALLATAAAAASTRAKREREVREAREHVETVLERVNGLIENTIEVLVQATTRDELEAGVVRELAAADPYTFAWIGRPDVASETLTPREWAGDADVPAADLAFDLDGDGPVATAYREGTTQVIQTLDDHPSPDQVDVPGVEASIVVPLVYTDTTYGVVTVFADEEGAFDERERVVLGALGRAVANAINAVERGRILDADRVIELEFSVDDAGLLFSRLSRAAKCSLSSAGTDYRSDGNLQVYLSAEGVDGEELLELAREDEDVREAKLIVDHDDECLLELVVEQSLVSLVTEHGAVPRSVTAEDGVARFTVELPYEAEARELFDLVKSRYPNTDLVGYHEHERPVETRQEFRAALSDRFTDRQETALRTAFLGGFFEWPRGIDGNELAEAMDISRPTYHQHLRAAQQKVLEELFDPQT
ncbi:MULTISPECIES: bacterio-opsin activator domain-containing protein [Salinibaculum]|uniref:bacterio-opsin activator domain-containing protein n=1 Tax=Salinibaculum TaxID=2732368 RepID=UPI0030D0BF9A